MPSMSARLALSSRSTSREPTGTVCSDRMRSSINARAGCSRLTCMAVRRPCRPRTLAREMPHDDQRCEICGGSLKTAIAEARDHHTGDRFSVLRCLDCGLGHTRPQPTDLDAYYGPAYRGVHGASERFCMSRRLRFVRAMGPSRRLLDFGCGDGGFLKAAAAAGLDAVGVELESRHARSNGLRVVEQLDDVGGTFDVLTLWHSLEHVPSPLDTMKSALTHLEAGGHSILTVPNFASLQSSVFGSLWFHLDLTRHLHHFTRKSLETLFDRLGF